MKKSYIKISSKMIIKDIFFLLLLLLFFILIVFKLEILMNNVYITATVSIFLILTYIFYRTIKSIQIHKDLTTSFEIISDGDFIHSNPSHLKYNEMETILNLLKESKLELRQIIDLVPHKLYAKDSDGTFLFVNKATAADYGLQPEDLEGKNNIAIYDLDDKYHRKEVEGYLLDDLEVISENRSKFIPEEINHTLDGSIKIMQTTKIPFRTHLTRKAAMFGISIDITDEKLVEKQIDKHQKEQEDNYNKLKEHSDKIDRLNRDLEEFQTEIVQIMIKMLEIHDKYTKGHSENVAKISRLMAMEMGLSDKIINQAYWAGILHDIGKTVVPKKILNKETFLNNDEFEYIKNHSLWGHSVLKSSKQFSEIANFVLYHHERWDSKGYPVGLEEDEIPLVSQILSIADTWDAMTSKRSYRDPLSEDIALKEIINGSGKQFSPSIVTLFEKLQKSGGLRDILLNQSTTVSG